MCGIKTVASLLLLSVLLAAGGGARAQCLSDDDGGGGGGAAITEAELSAVRVARADFALTLLREAGGVGGAGAALVSPSSAFDALLLAWMGAANQTEQKLRKTLRLPESLSKVSALRALRADAPLHQAQNGTSDDSQGVRSASRVFVAEGVTLRPCVEDLLKGDVESGLAVAADPEAAAAHINAWVANKTAGHIKKLVPTLRPDAQLVLANAAFFRGTWASRFPKERTSLEVFYKAPDKQSLVHMMKQKGSFNYVVSERLGAHVLELPFTGAASDCSLLVLLPPFLAARALNGEDGESGEGGVDFGVNALLKRLDAAALAELLRDADGAAQTVEVQMPKLSLNGDIDLVPVLEKMGVGDAFTSSADFSAFTGALGPSFDGARQLTRLLADEEGATAAAATALFLFRSARPAEPPRFIANHPFVFLLLRRYPAAAASVATPANAPADVLFAGVYRSPPPPPTHIQLLLNTFTSTPHRQ